MSIFTGTNSMLNQAFTVGIRYRAEPTAPNLATEFLRRVAAFISSSIEDSFQDKKACSWTTETKTSSGQILLKFSEKYDVPELREIKPIVDHLNTYGRPGNSFSVEEQAQGEFVISYNGPSNNSKLSRELGVKLAQRDRERDPFEFEE